MDVARNLGALKEGVRPSVDACRINRQSITLCADNGDLITRVPIHEARRMLAFRRQVARQALKQAGATIRGDSTATIERRTIRLQKEDVRALAWAISTARRFPVAPSPLQRRLTNSGILVQVILLLLSLLLGWTPILTAVLLMGLLPCAWLRWRQKQDQRRYHDDVYDLIRRWRTMGHPDPADSFFALYDL